MSEENVDINTQQQEEHQVGETEQGEAIMGTDRGDNNNLDNEFAQ